MISFLGRKKAEKEYVTSRLKKTGKSIMFWGGIAHGRRTELEHLIGDPDSARGGVTGRVYLALIQEILPAFYDTDDTFMQDGAPIHRSEIVMEWLDAEGIPVLDWPPYSPDLNPIENVWKVLKERIRKEVDALLREHSLLDISRRLEVLGKEVWEGIEQAMLDHLIDSIPRRIEACIAANGWYTKY